jgi:hypothetical protein
MESAETRTDQANGLKQEQGQPIGFDEVKRIGFELFTQGKVRRLAQGIYAVRTNVGSCIAEIQEGRWKCDCDQSHDESCSHIYAAQLSRLTVQISTEDNKPLRCRYCGSPDIRRCGFRYNARGIVRRYYCNECRRKFSIKYVGQPASETPSELIWVLNELGASLTRTNDLIAEINRKVSVIPTAFER